MDPNLFQLVLKMVASSAECQALESRLRIQSMTDADFQTIFEFALHNSILPIFYQKAIQFNYFEFFPSFFQALIQNEVRAQMIRNLRLRSVLSELVSAFYAENIKLVLLKGIELQYRLYNEPYLRPMIDIDLFLLEHDIEKASQLLFAKGAKPVVISETKYIDSLKHHSAPIMYKGIAIELHRRLTDLYDEVHFEKIDIWNETEVFTIEGKPCIVMKPELLLVYLCHHLFSTLRGGKIKLLAYYDILLLLEKYSDHLNQEKILKIMEVAKLKTSVYQTLAQIIFLFPMAPIPLALQTGTSRIQMDVPFLLGAMQMGGIQNARSHYFMKFMRIRSFAGKIQFLSGKFFPTGDYLNQIYGNSSYKTACKHLFTSLSIIFYAFAGVFFRFFIRIWNKLKKYRKFK